VTDNCRLSALGDRDGTSPGRRGRRSPAGLRGAGEFGVRQTKSSRRWAVTYTARQTRGDTNISGHRAGTNATFQHHLGHRLRRKTTLQTRAVPNRTAAPVEPAIYYANKHQSRPGLEPNTRPPSPSNTATPTSTSARPTEYRGRGLDHNHPLRRLGTLGLGHQHHRKQRPPGHSPPAPGLISAPAWTQPAAFLHRRNRFTTRRHSPTPDGRNIAQDRTVNRLRRLHRQAEFH